MVRFACPMRAAGNVQRAILFGKVLMFAAIAFATAALAQSPMPTLPIYNPASKSYFNLLSITDAERKFTERHELDAKWSEAAWLAKQKWYDGVPGRLAVIRDSDTYFFLLKTFHPAQPTWIGLRYICATRRLEWVDGKFQAKNAFQAWAAKWNGAIPGAGCRQQGAGGPLYMPVAVTPASQGFRWYAQGIDKGYDLYFVEFPTGHP